MLGREKRPKKKKNTQDKRIDDENVKRWEKKQEKQQQPAHTHTHTRARRNKAPSG